MVLATVTVTGVNNVQPKIQVLKWQLFSVTCLYLRPYFLEYVCVFSKGIYCIKCSLVRVPRVLSPARIAF